MTKLFSKKGRGARRIHKPEAVPGTKRINSARLKRIAGALSVIALTGLVALNSQRIIEYMNGRKVEFVAINGELTFVTENEVQRAVSAFVDESLLAIDLDRVKRALEDNPWIRKAGVRREWPDTLVIDVSEEIPIASWGGDRLLNEQGQIFAPDNVPARTNLADLSGPDGSARRVMEQYQEFNRILYPEGLRIGSLRLDERDAWSMTLSNGIRIEIGRQRPVERIRRLIDAKDVIMTDEGTQIESIDLRYSKGIAVRRRPDAGEGVVSL